MFDVRPFLFIFKYVSNSDPRQGIFTDFMIK